MGINQEYWLQILAFKAIVAGLSFAGCADEDQQRAPVLASTTQATTIEAVDTLEGSSPSFFPIALYVEGREIDSLGWDGAVTNGGYFSGGAPDNQSDAARFYAETFRHMRSMGANTFITPNVDTKYVGYWVVNDDHLKRIAWSAAGVDGIYAIPSSRALQVLAMDPAGTYQQNEVCRQETPGETGNAAQAVRHTLATVDARCVGGISAGSYC